MVFDGSRQFGYPPSFDRDSERSSFGHHYSVVGSDQNQMCGKHAADKEWEWAIGTDGDVVH